MSQVVQAVFHQQSSKWFTFVVISSSSSSSNGHSNCNISHCTSSMVGLDSILFAINIDNPELNGPSEKEGVAGFCPVTAPPVTTQEPEAHVAATATDIISASGE